MRYWAFTRWVSKEAAGAAFSAGITSSPPRLAGTAERAVRENRSGTGRAKTVGAVRVGMSVDQKVSRAETVPVVFLKS